MEKYKILTMPNPILRKDSSEVNEIDSTVINIAKRMVFTLTSNDLGLGLAAPQIGKNLRIIVVSVREVKDEDNKIIQKAIPLTVFINPVITKFSKSKNIEEEGCLCYLGYYGPVERPSKIKFEALTLDGKKVKMNAAGLFARVIQHEIDHLNGILFIDRLTDKTKLRKIDIENENYIN